jgi:hypothetical protein
MPSFHCWEDKKSSKKISKLFFGDCVPLIVHLFHFRYDISSPYSSISFLYLIEESCNNVLLLLTFKVYYYVRVYLLCSSWDKREQGVYYSFQHGTPLVPCSPGDLLLNCLPPASYRSIRPLILKIVSIWRLPRKTRSQNDGFRIILRYLVMNLLEPSAQWNICLVFVPSGSVSGWAGDPPQRNIDVMCNWDNHSTQVPSII